jgi:hypothetical protein
MRKEDCGLAKVRPGFARLRTAAAVVALASSMIAGPASAAVLASLEFVQPTGFVTPTQAIDVFLRLSLDASSDPLRTDSSGELVTPRFTDDEIASFQSSPPAGTEAVSGDPSQPYQSYFNVYFSCSGTFTNGCSAGTPYNFSFNTGPGSLSYPVNFSLDPGEALNVLYGTFTPSAGPVAAGTYTFFDAGFFMSFDQEIDGQSVYGSRDLASTCSSQSPSCAFTRTVAAAAVPEPASWAMMIGGLGLVGGMLRRRSLNTSAISCA